MRVAVLTLFRGNYNYGGMLQAYALPYVINKMGKDACQIAFGGGYNITYPSKLQQCKQYSLREIIAKIWQSHIERKTYLIEDKLMRRKCLFDKFEAEHIKVSRTYSISNINQLGMDYDAYVVGSDQVWNPNVANRFYVLDFPIKANALRISYAASIGRGYISRYEGKCMKPYLDEFDRISVREESAKLLLEKASVRLPITTVLDPTMLLSCNEWAEVCAERLIMQKYVLVYAFSDCKFKDDLYKYYKALGYEVVYIPYVKQRYNLFDGKTQMKAIWDVGPSEFLSLIRFADVVITDSFHGAVFSIIFNRDFYVFQRDNAKAKTSKNVRLTDLLRLFSLERRIITSMSDIRQDATSIDYEKVNSALARSVKFSKAWLESALNND